MTCKERGAMEYEIIYSDRKSIGIKVKDGIVTVRAPYGTEQERIQILADKHIDWIKKALKRDKLKRERYKELSDEEIKKLKKLAKEYFEEKCAYYASVMGLKYSRISITGAKGRFGSCSSKKSICFSYRLMFYPEAAREYVVVHELAHLLEMNHSERFYRIVEKYMPDYKKRKGLLKIQTSDPK